MCAAATWHGNNTHNAIKALHLDDLFGSKTGGCTPGAEIEVIQNRFSAAEHGMPTRNSASQSPSRPSTAPLSSLTNTGSASSAWITAFTISGVEATSLMLPSAAISPTRTAPHLSRSRSLWRQIPHPRHQPPQLGSSHSRRHRLSYMCGLGDIHLCDGPCPTTQARGKATPPHGSR